MKRYLSTFAVGLILYAVPGYSQTAQFEHSIPKRSTTNVAPVSPGVAKSPMRRRSITA